MFFLSKISRTKKGFTLVEMLVSVAVFLIISTALYRTYVSLFALASVTQFKILALNAANEQFEIIRNLSYSDVGEVNGIPNGKIPHTQTIVRGGVTFNVTVNIRNVDLPFDGTIGGNPNDLSPADNKLAEVRIDCPSCKNYTPITLTTTISPKNLETASTNGALFIKVFDANGLAVSGATVRVVNTKVVPNIVVQDETDVNGKLQIVDVPPGVQAYSIAVSKPGYSSAQTYPPGGTVNGYLNPTPTQPDATVVVQQVTQASFAIDQLSTLSFKSVSPICAPIGGIDFNLSGSKTVGASIPKFISNMVTDGSGNYSSTTMEWDSYNVTGIDSNYDIVGINPLNSIPLNPHSTQDVKLIVAPKNPRSLLITVKDSATQLPLTGVTVEVTGPSSYSNTQVTDRGYMNQTDWSGGAGQEIYTSPLHYFLDNGNVAVNAPTGEIKLKNVFGSYVSNGTLESSTIDTGSPSNFYNLVWSPTDQPVATGPDSLRFQFATNKELTATTTWDYKGPDGTSSTFYTPANSVINSIHNGDQYVRYRVLLSTLASTSTPNVSDIAFTFTSSCTPPGQVVFSGLNSGTYHVTASKSGYTTSQVDVSISSSANWTEQQIILAP